MFLMYTTMLQLFLNLFSILFPPKLTSSMVIGLPFPIYVNHVILITTSLQSIIFLTLKFWHSLLRTETLLEDGREIIEHLGLDSSVHQLPLDHVTQGVKSDEVLQKYYSQLNHETLQKLYKESS